MATAKQRGAARAVKLGRGQAKALNQSRAIAAAKREEKRNQRFAATKGAKGRQLASGVKGNRTVVHAGGGPTVINSES